MRPSYQKSAASNGFEDLPPSKSYCILKRFLCPIHGIAMMLILAGGCFAGPVRADEGRQVANVVQRGNFAYAYDAKGLQLFTISAGDGIAGFTQSTVSIRRGNFIHTYNEKGLQISVIPGPRN